MSLSTHLLSWLIWLPIVGGFVVLALGQRATLAKWISLVVSAIMNFYGWRLGRSLGNT